ncbi:AMMECR1 domain-containing protein [Sphaerosporella brunnea]|uniref:AMMECR1 domain-containing protein n=1 Tax=Sphaerosporella brunnea TaxID=1250544 RepID=A0A5J5EPE0_9PEZI|nr:AMMECR1 domain-containing protein [Sphaerosporella brunnea]
MATDAHCFYCFDVLASHLLGERQPHSLSKFQSLVQKKRSLPPPRGEALTNGVGALPARMPLFVTWKKRSASGHMDLRGCIGTFDAKPLEAGLRDYALTAGLHDHRFGSISAKELPHLQCGVTLLTDFETAADPMDWTLGVHGIQIEFTYHQRKMGATYLPDVPSEQGWTPQETIISLMRKAGWTGKREEWKKIPLRVTRYQGKVHSVSWEGYQAMLKEFKENGEEEETEGDEKQAVACN